MALNIEDVRQVARLSKLPIAPEEEEGALKELNNIFGMIETMLEVDTEGVEPLYHPHERPCPMRDDEVTVESMRDELLARAPMSENGFFLVPKVIE